MKTEVLIFVLALVACCSAGITYNYKNHTYTAPAAQLWYEGLWKEVPWLNGSITWNLNENTKGKIYVSSTFAPHEPHIRAAQRQGAIGYLAVRTGHFPPGFSMFVIDASDRREIVIPVMEVIFPRSQPLKSLPEGSYITIQPSPNRHKKANETPFQLVLNLIQSFWELAIIALGVYRLYQFYGEQGLPFLSVAPICCLFEVVAATLRLSYTCVDPFYTYRMIPDRVSLIFVTISMPFSETAGILLTFFWAESLNKHNVKAVPFISHYKWPAFLAIGILYSVEIIANILRVVLINTGSTAIYISLALYLLIATSLAVCYIVTALMIKKRVAEMGIKSGKGIIRSLTTRIVVSSSGYIVYIISLIAYAIFNQQVLGRQICLNICFIGLNLAGIMQVYALRPTGNYRSTSGRSKPSSSPSSSPDSESPQAEPATPPTSLDNGVGSEKKLLSH